VVNVPSPTFWNWVIAGTTDVAKSSPTFPNIEVNNSCICVPVLSFNEILPIETTKLFKLLFSESELISKAFPAWYTVSYRFLNTKENWLFISESNPVKYVFSDVLDELPNQDFLLTVVAIVWYALPSKEVIAFFSKASAKVIPESCKLWDTDVFPNNPPIALFIIPPNRLLICPIIGIFEITAFIGFIKVSIFKLFLYPVSNPPV